MAFFLFCAISLVVKVCNLILETILLTHNNVVYPSRIAEKFLWDAWLQLPGNRFWHPISSSSCSGRIKFDSCSLYPQNEIGPSISSSAVLCVFVLLVYIVVIVWVACLCPSSVCVVATFPGTVLFPLLYTLLLFFP